MAVEKGKAAKAPVKKLSSEDLAEFKEAVQGSNLTKIELLKALKKRYMHMFAAHDREALTNGADFLNSQTRPSKIHLALTSPVLVRRQQRKDGSSLAILDSNFTSRPLWSISNQIVGLLRTTSVGIQ